MTKVDAAPRGAEYQGAGIRSVVRSWVPVWFQETWKYRQFSPRVGHDTATESSRVLTCPGLELSRGTGHLELEVECFLIT